ncbi:YPTC1, partial [Symbiodinium pilosum]
EEEPAAVSTAALNAAHTVVMHCKFLTSLLEPPWAVVWRGLDRLVSARDVRVSVSPDRQSSRTHFSKATRELLARLSEEVTFPMSLHPPHISWSQTAAEEYWFLSDRIRMQGIPHCNDAFMDLMETFDFHRIMRQSSWPTRFVDIGAHLGDCSLWAAARWGRGGGGLQGLAVEHREANAAAIRRAAKMAGLTQGVLRVLTAEAVSQAPCLPSLEDPRPALAGLLRAH